MSGEPMAGRVACPICRRQQSPQARCERCGSDLELLAAAAAELSEGYRRLAAARAAGAAATVLVEAERLLLLAGPDPMVEDWRATALAVLRDVRLPAAAPAPSAPAPEAAPAPRPGPDRAALVADWLRRRQSR